MRKDLETPQIGSHSGPWAQQAGSLPPFQDLPVTPQTWFSGYARELKIAQNTTSSLRMKDRRRFEDTRQNYILSDISDLVGR